VQPKQSRQTLQSNRAYYIMLAMTIVNQTVNSLDHHTATEPLTQHSGIRHPIQDKPMLKRIPKCARPAVSNLLIKLIQNVLSSPSTEASWTKLLYFSTACLAKPDRGGISRSLTTKQIRLYCTQVEPSSMSPKQAQYSLPPTD